MSSSIVEPISSEPVIVNRTYAESVMSHETIKPVEDSESLESRILKLESLLAAQKLDKATPRSRSPSPRPPHRSRSRSHSPVVVRRRLYHSPIRSEELPIITNTTTLLNVLEKDSCSPDGLIEIQSGGGRFNTHVAYMTSLPVQQTDLEKISWIFKLGLEDSWVQKPVNFTGRDNWTFDFPGGTNFNGRRVRRADYYDNDCDNQRFDRGQTPVIKIGTLFNTVFKGNNAAENIVDDEERKVKFISVLQAQGNPGWARLMVSYSRAAALADIFHEVVNGFSLMFVGAVLKTANIPPSRTGFGPGGGEDFVYKKVESVTEAEECGNAVIGVLC